MVSQPARNRAIVPGSPEDSGKPAALDNEQERVMDVQPAAKVLTVSPPPQDKLAAEIRETAFYKFEGRVRQGQPGDPVDDWLDAEREVVDRWHSPLEDLAPPKWDDSPRRSWKK